MNKDIKINIRSSETVRSPFASGHCKKYRLALKYKGVTFTFNFHGSVHDHEHGKMLNKKDVMYCLLADMGCYDYTRNIKDFLNEFGYDEFELYPYIENGYTINDLYSFASDKDVDQLRTGIKAYKESKRTYERLHEIFNNKELEELEKEFQDY